MIRKAIIVVLMLGMLVVGVLWADSYVQRPRQRSHPLVQPRSGWKIDWHGSTFDDRQQARAWHNSTLTLSSGNIEYHSRGTHLAGRITRKRTTIGRYGLEEWSGRGMGSRRILLPLWPAFPLLAIYPAIAFVRGPVRGWRRRRKGLCIRCSYDLTGNVSGICPECGRTTDVRSTEPPLLAITAGLSAAVCIVPLFLWYLDHTLVAESVAVITLVASAVSLLVLTNSAWLPAFNRVRRHLRGALGILRVAVPVLLAMAA